MEEKKNSEMELSETVAETAEDLHGENLTDRVKMLSPGQMVAKRFFRSKLSVIGLITLIVLFLFSFIGPLIPPFNYWAEYNGQQADVTNIPTIYDEHRIEYEDENGNIVIAYEISERNPNANILGDLTLEHPLGTDEKGFDVLTRLMLGGRVSLTIGFVVIILETIIGVVLGGFAGYFGGWVDQLVMRIVDILSCIPTLPIMFMLSAMLTANGITDMRSLYYLMIILTLFGWAGTARLVRGQILSLREQEFMLAAKCSGLSVGKKIFKHLLPNVLPQLIVSMTLGLGGIILTEATLGYLGIGAPIGSATWGNMINYASNETYLKYYFNLWAPAGICIMLAILAFNFVGDGLRDAFDPKMKR